MAKKLEVWLNNKLNKCLHCAVVIKFYRIFVTELVFTFFVFKYENHFEFPKDGKRSLHLKILEIPGGRGGHQRPPGTENPGGWGVQIKKSSVGGYGYFLEPHIVHKETNNGFIYRRQLNIPYDMIESRLTLDSM